MGEAFPEIYVKGGIMERGNFSACAGFSSHSGRCAVFGTFAAFQEMILSEAARGWHGKEVGKSIDVPFGCMGRTDHVFNFWSEDRYGFECQSIANTMLIHANTKYS